MNIQEITAKVQKKRPDATETAIQSAIEAQGWKVEDVQGSMIATLIAAIPAAEAAAPTLDADALLKLATEKVLSATGDRAPSAIHDRADAAYSAQLSQAQQTALKLFALECPEIDTALVMSELQKLRDTYQGAKSPELQSDYDAALDVFFEVIEGEVTAEQDPILALLGAAKVKV